MPGIEPRYTGVTLDLPGSYTCHARCSSLFSERVLSSNILQLFITPPFFWLKIHPLYLLHKTGYFQLVDAQRHAIRSSKNCEFTVYQQS